MNTAYPTIADIQHQYVAERSARYFDSYGRSPRDTDPIIQERDGYTMRTIATFGELKANERPELAHFFTDYLGLCDTCYTELPNEGDCIHCSPQAEDAPRYACFDCNDTGVTGWGFPCKCARHDAAYAIYTFTADGRHATNAVVFQTSYHANQFYIQSVNHMNCCPEAGIAEVQLFDLNQDIAIAIAYKEEPTAPTLTAEQFREAMHNPELRAAALAYAASTYDDPVLQDAYNLSRAVDMVGSLDRHNRAALRQQCTDPDNTTHAVIRSLIDTFYGEF